MNPALLQLARRLHRVKAFRSLAKRIARRRIVEQSFHGGLIAMNAVEHSWAWTGKRRLEDFDRFLQDRLLELSRSHPHLLDIGGNIGVMTLSVLLRNLEATATVVEPNAQANAVLQRSLRRNRLEARVRVLPHAVSDGAATLPFDPTGSFTGHVAATGLPCPAVGFSTLLAEETRGPTVVKIDIEGFEARLCEEFAAMRPRENTVFVIELHPRGFNNLGDPARVVETLRRRGDLQLRLLDGDLASLDPTQFRHLEATFGRCAT